MNEIITLNNLKINQECIIYKIHSKGIMRRRLMDIGIIPGTIIKSVLKSPSGNPTAYLIKESVIALRNEDAKQIEVKPL
ncbi:MAG: ferrous iron transport protein A [Bacilli bacterium]|nr:ferrous iron transport protein A [Bacilli bacterium]